MKDHAASHPQRQRQRLTRAQRRAAERAQPRQRKPQRRSLPTNAIVGGLVTLLALIAISVYVYSQTLSSTGLKGVADPNALNPGTTTLSIGSVAPDFTLNDTNGRAYHLAAQRGHPVLLEFFATWCPVCHAEAPILAKLTRTYEPRGVRVWSVLANPYGPNYELSHQSDLSLATMADLQWYASTYDVRHPQLIDPTFATVNQYGISKYPGLYIVDKAGVLRLVAAGGVSYGTIARSLDATLK